MNFMDIKAKAKKSFKVYCELCKKHQPVNPVQLRKDNLNKKPWGDIVCSKCNFVIATLVLM